MKIGKHTARLAEQFRVHHGRSFRLKDFDSAETHGLLSKDKAAEVVERNLAHLQDLQEKLYAQDQWALLLIFQAMDAAGKDGVSAGTSASSTARITKRCWSCACIRNS